MKFHQVYCKESYDLVHFGEILVQSNSKYIKTVSLNVFLVSLSNVPFLYSLKTLEKLRFQGRGGGVWKWSIVQQKKVKFEQVFIRKEIFLVSLLLSLLCIIYFLSVFAVYLEQILVGKRTT